jgi:hypothetical protein
MSGRNSDLLKDKPKRPLNFYFKFRAEKLEEYKDEPDKMKKIKKDWKNIDDKVKEKEAAVTEANFAQY